MCEWRSVEHISVATTQLFDTDTVHAMVELIGITASPSLRVIGRSHRAGDATYNNGQQSAGRDPSQPISDCLQTFTENSLLYSVFLLTLFLITFSPRADDIVKCP